MTVLLVGVSYLSAPLSVLEQVAVVDADRPGLLARLLRSPAITEAMVVSTCNRVEVYAVVNDRRDSAAEVTDVLARHAEIAPTELAQHCYVHREDAAARHLFEVASGLDSLVVGDEQILGQVRAAYLASDVHGAAGPVLHALAQPALRTGKQVATDTNLARAGASMVTVALEHAAAALPGSTLAGRRAVVLGAGTMGSLAVAHLQRLDVAEIVVVNRTAARASQLAASMGSPAVRAVPTTELGAALASSDVLLVCTTSPGAVVGLTQARAAAADRTGDRDPLVICDLGLPRNVDPAVAALPGVVLLDLHTLHRRRPTDTAAADIAAAQRIVTAQLATYSNRLRSAQAAPAVVALREQAAAVVHAELARLEGRLPDLDAAVREEVARAVRRVADKLLHAPTVALHLRATLPDADQRPPLRAAA